MRAIACDVASPNSNNPLQFPLDSVCMTTQIGSSPKPHDTQARCRNGEIHTQDQVVRPAIAPAAGRRTIDVIRPSVFDRSPAVGRPPTFGRPPIVRTPRRAI